jgi:hypothetical protein
MNRRSLIQTLIGGVAAVSSGVSPKEAAKALGVPLAMVPPGTADTLSERASISVGVGCASAGVLPGWRVTQTLREHRSRLDQPERYLPPHIAAMKSWSPVYKASVAARERDIFERYLRKIENDETFAEKVIACLGGIE